MTDTNLPADTEFTTQQVADRLGLTTAELSELRLKSDDLSMNVMDSNCITDSIRYAHTKSRRLLRSSNA